ncbi:hypothetical protein BUALT_Bualt11G0061800 [Buddleja alternifolia]|uniref:Retrotransposon Copia-like N-terminal domain-containing protein n=1 Tax=Buddleja alternifolia TaxID=168488 RepID=A0AAV6WXQ6_9LAMI|nr:hypothetical protein BUALT_Bualt11G0061800 [Buddleja alternifolia]
MISFRSQPPPSPCHLEIAAAEANFQIPAPPFPSVSLRSHATSVTVFNGLNFSEWREQVNFHLGVLDLDLALLEEKPTDITDEISDTEKLKRKAWDSYDKEWHYEIYLCAPNVILLNVMNYRTKWENEDAVKAPVPSVEELPVESMVLLPAQRHLQPQ